jgi:hypothetical protein
MLAESTQESGALFIRKFDLNYTSTILEITLQIASTNARKENFFTCYKIPQSFSGGRGIFMSTVNYTTNSPI